MADTRSHDVIILGSGPAGLQAALFCARGKLNTLVMGKSGEGMLKQAERIGNYLAMDAVSGPKFLLESLGQVQRYGVQVEDVEFTDAYLTGDRFTVKDAYGNTRTAKSLILACGRPYIKSDIPGEAAYVGKGIVYNAFVDGPTLVRKTVAVIGNGNYAAEQALQLKTFTSQITVFLHGERPQFSDYYRDALAKAGIPVRPEKIIAFGDGDRLTRLVLDTGEVANIDGALIALGWAGASMLAGRLGLQTVGSAIKAERSGETNVKLVYAAGAVTGGNEQIAKSVGEGCNAALSCVRSLTGQRYYVDQW